MPFGFIWEFQCKKLKRKKGMLHEIGYVAPWFAAKYGLQVYYFVILNVTKAINWVSQKIYAVCSRTKLYFVAFSGIYKVWLSGSVISQQKNSFFLFSPSEWGKLFANDVMIPQRAEWSLKKDPDVLIDGHIPIVFETFTYIREI